MSFRSEEIALLSNPAFFEQKAAATEKLKRLMEQIRLAYLAAINPQELLAPPETDFQKGQIAKGENYEGYPYVMLDFPKRFSRESVFTFRSMFWFGHCLIFSAILAGEHLARYRQNFERAYDSLCAANLFFGIDDVWDWRESASLPIAPEYKARILGSEQPFLKLLKRLPPSVLANERRAIEEAVDFYQTIKPVLRK